MAQREAVLIVDDDPDVRTLMSNVLSEYGFAIFEASCGEEGLRMARERQPSAVVLDVQTRGCFWGPTTTFRSRSRSASCSRACRRWSAAGRGRPRAACG